MNALPDDFLDQLRAVYPRRLGAQGWADVKRLVLVAVAKGSAWNDIFAGTLAYSKFCDHTGKTGTELVKMAATFFGRGEWWLEDYSIPLTPEQQREVVRRESLKQRAQACGFTRYSLEDPRISLTVFESALRDFEGEKSRPVLELVRGIKK